MANGLMASVSHPVSKGGLHQHDQFVSIPIVIEECFHSRENWTEGKKFEHLETSSHKMMRKWFNVSSKVYSRFLLWKDRFKTLWIIACHLSSLLPF